MKNPILTYSVIMLFLMVFPLLGNDFPVKHASIKPSEIRECSGITKSKRYPGVFWVINDSGNPARLYAIDSRGRAVSPPGTGKYRGIKVTGAMNRDWEDITSDEKGNLIIADTGNNLNNRKDLCLYIFLEPDPRKERFTKKVRRVPVEFPGRKAKLSYSHNWDCEAVFVRDGDIYVMTKHRKDTRSVLYVLRGWKSGKVNYFRKVSTFEAGDMVTAADSFGNMAAVLTYSDVLIFPLQKKGPFQIASTRRIPLSAGQCEGICFDGKYLIITNEERDIYRLKIR